ncbi:MAG TPA: cysteine synthase A [Oligoflexus sp.]|nr:cysteine synthase A [Oligoflexus sp.]HET9238555.1 cysteine synthase A [Oligoflexus sp.]
MKPMLAHNLVELVGRTPLLKIPSLSRLSQCDIFVKCEFMNPGGSIKDRAALAMVQDAIADGRLKPGMTIVEGTAGNTGIGLAIAAKAFGFKMLVVMPKGQTPEKERMIALHGAELMLVDPCPFKDPKHFYHTAKRIADEKPDQYFWANQFENLSNFRAHYDFTGPEILQQTSGRLDALVSAAGTGGTIGGCSVYLKEQLPDIKVVLADPEGSGLYTYVKTGEFKSEGSSLTEGIGIMRLVANFAQAKVDTAVRVTDRQLITVARYVRDEDGLVLGSSSALNAAAALHTALQMGPGHRVVTFACDLGERSFSKLWSPEYLKAQKLDEGLPTMGQLVAQYHELSL